MVREVICFGIATRWCCLRRGRLVKGNIFLLRAIESHSRAAARIAMLAVDGIAARRWLRRLGVWLLLRLLLVHGRYLSWRTVCCRSLWSSTSGRLESAGHAMRVGWHYGRGL